jgi:hypothetical protein
MHFKGDETEAQQNTFGKGSCNWTGTQVSLPTEGAGSPRGCLQPLQNYHQSRADQIGVQGGFLEKGLPQPFRSKE